MDRLLEGLLEDENIYFALKLKKVVPTLVKRILMNEETALQKARFAYIMEYLSVLFTDEADKITWLLKPNDSLPEQVTPLSLLDTELGFEMLKGVICSAKGE